MKKLILTLMTGAAILGTSNADIETNISTEVGTKVATATGRNGLLLRGDSTNYFANLGSDIAGGHATLGFNLADLHGGGNDLDLSFGYSRSITILGQDFLTDFYYKEFDSQFGDWEEIGVATSYSTQWVDVAGGLWKQVGGGQFGVNLALSRGFEVINENLTLTPFFETSLAEDFQSYISGVKLGYDLGNGVVFNGVVELVDNNAGGGYAIDSAWVYGGSLSIKF